MNKKLKSTFKSNEIYIFLIIIALGILVQIAMIVPGMFAVAEFLAIIAGGIDVSFPALASLSAYASTKILLDQNYDGNVVLAFVSAMAIGAL